jgi:3-deoxy-D-manno-octulosonic acid hydroxylase-like protein
MPIRTIDAVTTWGGEAVAPHAGTATECIEGGDVLVLRNLPFEIAPEERTLLTASASDGHSKNVSFDPTTRRLDGCAFTGRERELLARMLGRFVHQTCALIDGLLPRYHPSRAPSLASYRPIEIENRPSTVKTDDTRLHVDAFPARPMAGQRILRVFTNINPHGVPRVWDIGEPFERVVQRFLPLVPRYSPLVAWALEWRGRTRGRRTEYDHVMLSLHDLCKRDARYQAACDKTRVEFKAGWTWICYTDQVSHAALAGRHALEQTMLVPVSAMADPERAPLRVLERALNRRLDRPRRSVSRDSMP